MAPVAHPATGEEEPYQQIWVQTFLGDAVEIVAGIPEGIAHMASKAWEDGLRMSKPIPPGPFKGLSHLVWSAASLVDQTVWGIIEGGRRVYALGCESLENPDPVTTAHLASAGVALLASFGPLLRPVHLKVPLPKGGGGMPALALAPENAGVAGAAAGEGAASAAVALRPPPLLALFREEAAETLPAEEPTTPVAGTTAAEGRARVLELTRKRAEIIGKNPELKQALEKSGGLATKEIQARFADAIRELEQLTNELHAERRRINGEMLCSKEAQQRLGGESIGGNAGQDGIALNAWVDVDSGLIERFGNPQDAFPMDSAGTPVVPAHLKNVAFRINVREGKITGVLSDSTTVAARMKQHVGQKVALGVDDMVQIYAQRKEGRLVTTRDKWEVMKPEELAPTDRVVAVRGRSFLELREIAEPAIMAEPDLRVLAAEGTEPVIMGIFLDGERVGRVAYGVSKKELVLENIVLMQRGEGLGSAVVTHLIESARETGRRTRIHNVMNPEGIAGMLVKEGYDGIVVLPSGFESLSLFDPAQYAFVSDIIVK